MLFPWLLLLLPLIVWLLSILALLLMCCCCYNCCSTYWCPCARVCPSPCPFRGGKSPSVRTPQLLSAKAGAARQRGRFDRKTSHQTELCLRAWAVGLQLGAPPVNGLAALSRALVTRIQELRFTACMTLLPLLQVSMTRRRRGREGRQAETAKRCCGGQGLYRMGRQGKGRFWGPL